ncbi:hypothetical protein T439DRAFT_320754 [Meredithblackwellia eburnea MCA 4105]
MAPCVLCPTSSSSPPPRRALLRRPKTLQPVCKECFYEVFETEIHWTIMGYGMAEAGAAGSAEERCKGKGKERATEEAGGGEGVKGVQEGNQTGTKRKGLFRRGEKVAIGASGGKDSTVLAYIMKLLNERYDYGLDLFLLSIDEGISGYRDASLDTVKLNAKQYGLPLKILSYKELYGGWTMDKVVDQVGKKGNCTYCGVFRRQALDKGASGLEVDHVVTGHNADDVAETVLMNVLRGDVPRLERCTAITTGSDLPGVAGTIKRSKPFKYTYEKEIVLYAYFKKLDYHSTECIYSPTAYRGHARALVKDLESVRPSAIIDIIYSGEAMASSLKLQGRRANGLVDELESASSGAGASIKGRPVQRTCVKCGCLSSQELCQACVLLEGLNKGVAGIQLEVGA